MTTLRKRGQRRLAAIIPGKHWTLHTDRSYNPPRYYWHNRLLSAMKRRKR